ncbi:MAG: UDP-N-acetylglucosamine 2-epimerase [Lachnospiraceae bacterium]|nr:UDP-N-acetylglucosamine 2-epimerase [Lachnospiraceae bacterium]
MSNDSRKVVGVLTTTRAEYGILYPLIEKMLKDTFFDVKVLVSGTHLDAEYGNSVQEIENDKVPIAAKIDILSHDDSPFGVSKTMSIAVSKFAEYFAENKLDALVVLGDRYEVLAVCIAAMNERIPIIHLHGGETTEGAIDECIRHSITKMSQLHLTATDEYRGRVIQLGENPNRVFNIGSIGVENVLKKNLLSKDELKVSLEEMNNSSKIINLDNPYGIVTFHPVTLEENSAIDQINNLIDALDEHKELSYIITLANADSGGKIINEKIMAYARERENVYVFASLGALRYLSAVKYSAMVIGNSSSGIIEVPSFNIPTVNIGDRQKGRVRANSVIDCGPSKEDISNAITKAESKEFVDVCISANNPYFKEDASRNAVEIIKKYLSSDIDLKKVFYTV